MNVIRCLLLVCTVYWLTACERGPDETKLRTQIQTMLEAEFQPGLFEVISLKRAGSAPSRDRITGDEQLIVYYNAQLKFLEDYNLSSWGQLGIGTLSFLLGATENGITGFHPGGNLKGDFLQVYGTTHYALRSGEWQPISFSQTEDRTDRSHKEIPKVIKMLESLEAIYDENSARLGGKEIGILEKELSRATRKINRQLDVLENVFSVASGPVGGNYYQIATALENSLRYTNVRTNNYETDGSAENCKLIQDKAIDFAIAQNNVAAMAYQGVDFFRPSGAMSDLRAVASLYPEVVHIVVPQSLSFESLLDLKGKRIDIGLPNSGSRIDALQILDIAHLKLSDFSVVTEKTLANSIAALRNGELDGFFVTIEAPAPAIQTLAATYPIKLLPVTYKETDKLSAYIPITIPANTYPQQSQDITSIGVSALLLANKDIPDQRVWDFLDAVMRSLDVIVEENIKAAFISRQTAQTGITIPLHPGARAYFE